MKPVWLKDLLSAWLIPWSLLFRRIGKPIFARQGLLGTELAEWILCSLGWDLGCYDDQSELAHSASRIAYCELPAGAAKQYLWDFAVNNFASTYSSFFCIIRLCTQLIRKKNQVSFECLSRLHIFAIRKKKAIITYKTFAIIRILWNLAILRCLYTNKFSERLCLGADGTYFIDGFAKTSEWNKVPCVPFSFWGLGVFVTDSAGEYIMHYADESPTILLFGARVFLLQAVMA